MPGVQSLLLTPPLSLHPSHTFPPHMQAFAVKSETPRVAVLKVLPSLLPALEDPSTCFRKFTKVALSHLNLNTLKLIKKTCLQLYDAYMRLFAALCAVSAQEVLRLALKDGPSGFDDLLHTFAQLSLAPLPRDTLVSALTAVSHLLAEEATLEELAPGKTAALKRCLVVSQQSSCASPPCFPPPTLATPSHTSLVSSSLSHLPLCRLLGLTQLPWQHW